MQLVDKEHQFKIIYDRYMRYLFIASGVFMAVIIASIFPLGSEVSTVAFLHALNSNPQVVTNNNVFTNRFIIGVFIRKDIIF